MICWYGAIALVLGIILGAAAAFELPNSESIAIGLAVIGALSIICSVYWFTRPPCEPDTADDSDLNIHRELGVN
jgi:hypothetical protein